MCVRETFRGAYEAAGRVPRSTKSQSRGLGAGLMDCQGLWSSSAMEGIVREIPGPSGGWSRGGSTELPKIAGTGRAFQNPSRPLTREMMHSKNVT